LDDQESNCFDFQEVEVIKLLEELSYSSTFLDNVVKAASDHGITNARWIVVQYSFEYDPARVSRKIEDDPVFIGSFPYSTT
jgi:hypothetical protein